MNKLNQNKLATIRGVLTDIRSIPTQTGMVFAVCKVGEHKCKLFGDLAKLILANQYESEGQDIEAFGHWDVRRGNEFVIDGFGKQPIQSMSKPVTDNRPDNAAMEVKDHYIVITIPAAVTKEQVRQIIEIANRALRAVGPGEFGDTASAQVETIHPKDQVEVGDIEF
jgi:hypothetical protein